MWSISQAIGTNGRAQKIVIVIFRSEAWTVFEVLDRIEELNNREFDTISRVALEPPDVRPETDKDSENEEPAEGAANRLTGFQLRAQAHVRQEKTTALHADDEPLSAATDEPQTAANDEPPSAANDKLPSAASDEPPSAVSDEPQTAGTSARIRLNAPKYTFKRVPRLPSLDLPIFSKPDYSKYRDFSAIELFELFWDDSLLQSIIEQMELYSAWKNMEIFRPSVGEVRTFLGILLLSGYHKLPQRWMYWSDDEDIGSALVKGSMRKKRFELFM